MRNAITDVAGIRVGHASDFEGYTGCSIILCESGAVCGVDVRGSAAGTRQVDSLSVAHVVEEVHAVLLCGGSAFGLEAATGVMRYFEEKHLGFDVGITRVPIVPAAVIFDLGFGSVAARPTAEMGYRACIGASEIVEEGSVGAGVGATVGKLFGTSRAMKGGVGTSSVAMPDGLIVGAFVVVNAFGDIVENTTGEMIAGSRDAEDPYRFANTVDCLKRGIVRKPFSAENTTLGVVATNARFNKREMTKIAQMAQAGLIKTISPVHTTFDGDLIFALCTGEVEADVNRVGVLADFVLSEAIKRGVKKADGFGKLPTYREVATTRRRRARALFESGGNL